MSAVFISYRRNDSSGHTGRIYDHLCSEFGKEYVFRDIDTIEPGTDFVDAVEKGIQECSVLIVVIGKEWLTAEDDMGRRLDDPNDFVRIEIASSLKKGLRVIPVLVKGAGMPSARDLPEDIAPLSRRLALDISDSRWDYDMQRLIEALSDFILQDRQAENAIEDANTREDTDNRVATDDAVDKSDPDNRDSTMSESSATASAVKSRRGLITAITVICLAILIAIVFRLYQPSEEIPQKATPGIEESLGSVQQQNQPGFDRGGEKPQAEIHEESPKQSRQVQNDAIDTDEELLTDTRSIEQEEERRIQQEQQQEEERRAQQQQQQEMERRQEEQREEEIKAQQQKVERERQKLVAEKKRKQAQASRKREACKESCSKRYQSCLKKSRPATGNCSSQARTKCKQAQRTCLLDPQNTMLMGVSGIEAYCNGQVSRCIKLKTAQCSGSMGSTGSACETAFSSCKKACR